MRLIATGVRWSFVWRKRYVLLCITNLLPSCNVYIPEYMSHISVLYITFLLKLPSKDAAWPFNVAKIDEKLACDLSPPGDTYMTHSSQLHHTIEQSLWALRYTEIREIYHFACPTKFGFKIWCLYFYRETYNILKKKIVKKHISSIFSLCYCQTSKRLQLLSTVPFVAGKCLVCYQFLNKRVSIQTRCCLSWSWRGATFDDAYYNYYQDGVNFPRQLI